MLRFLFTYKRLLVVILAVATAIPCTIKKELKQHQAIEVNQNPNKTKTTCSSYCSTRQVARHKENRNKPNEKPVYHFGLLTAKVDYRQPDLPFTDTYQFLKEKIPSHLLHRQFLI